MHAGLSLLVAAIIGVGGCGDRSPDVVQDGDATDRSRLFTLMPTSVTGVDFANRLRDTKEMNVFTYRN